MTKEFKQKLKTRGTTDTKKYRYTIKNGYEIYRIKLEYLDTTAAYTEWEKVDELK